MENKEEIQEDEETGPEYKVSKKVSVDQLLSMDEDDESLKKYKASLGLGAEKSPDVCPPNDPRRVVIMQFAIECEGRPGGIIEYRFDNKEQLAKLKDQPFTLKEGCNYKISVTFKVQHELVTGLKYCNVVNRMGVKVSKDELMIGSYAPAKEPYKSTFPRNGWDTAPSGFTARGKYKAKSQFIDDDKNVHLEYEYSFEIKKDWD